MNDKQSSLRAISPGGQNIRDSLQQHKSHQNYSNLLNKIDKNDDFNFLAKKIRAEKMNKEVIMKYKTEAATIEKQRLKRKKAIILIQSAFRGRIFRRKFSKILEEFNTATIVQYLYEKRKKRIRKNARQIIAHYIMEYVEKRRQIRKIVFLDYLSYCETFISKIWKGYKIRSQIKGEVEAMQKAKLKIFYILLGHKTRSVINTTKLYDVAIEIATIKKYLNNLDKSQGRDHSEKTERLREEFSKKLPKLSQTFYEEYYKLFKTGRWVQFPQVEKGRIWDNYTYILNQEDMGDNAEENDLNKSDLLSSSFIRDRADKKGGGRNTASKSKSPHVQIRNSLVANEKKQGKNEAKQETEYDDRPLNLVPKKINDISNLSEFPGANVGDSLKPEEGDQEQGSKKKKHEPIRRKPPKYDARKAIEEAKEKEGNATTGASTDSKSLSLMIKKNREESKLKDSMNESKLKTIKEKDKEMDISRSRNDIPHDEVVVGGGGGGFGGGFGGGVSSSNTKKGKEEKEEHQQRSRAKVQTTELNMRKKLHEMERSPPPKVNIKNVKSKLDCWASDDQISNIKSKKDSEKLNSTNLKQAKFDENFLDDIKTDFGNLSTKYNRQQFFDKKITTMSAIEIPYIRSDSFYVKNFTNEIFEELKVYLLKQHEELKN